MFKTIMIGAGGIASQHCEAMKKLGVEIIGIYDVDKERAGRQIGRASCRERV